jgi:hypothetical protein
MRPRRFAAPAHPTRSYGLEGSVVTAATARQKPADAIPGSGALDASLPRSASAAFLEALRSACRINVDSAAFRAHCALRAGARLLLRSVLRPAERDRRHCRTNFPAGHSRRASTLIVAAPARVSISGTPRYLGFSSSCRAGIRNRLPAREVIAPPPRRFPARNVLRSHAPRG